MIRNDKVFRDYNSKKEALENLGESTESLNNELQDILDSMEMSISDSGNQCANLEKLLEAAETPEFRKFYNAQKPEIQGKIIKIVEKAAKSYFSYFNERINRVLNSVHSKNYKTISWKYSANYQTNNIFSFSGYIPEEMESIFEDCRKAKNTEFNILNKQYSSDSLNYSSYKEVEKDLEQYNKLHSQKRKTEYAVSVTKDVFWKIFKVIGIIILSIIGLFVLMVCQAI